MSATCTSVNSQKLNKYNFQQKTTDTKGSTPAINQGVYDGDIYIPSQLNPQNTGLSIEKCAILSEIYNLERFGKRCFKSNATLALRLGKSEPTIKRMISSLVKDQWVVSENRYVKSKHGKERTLSVMNGLRIKLILNLGSNRSLTSDQIDPIELQGRNTSSSSNAVASVKFDFDLLFDEYKAKKENEGFSLTKQDHETLSGSLDEYKAGVKKPSKARMFQWLDKGLNLRMRSEYRTAKIEAAKDEKLDAVTKNLKAQADKINKQAEEIKPKDRWDTDWANDLDDVDGDVLFANAGKNNTSHHEYRETSPQTSDTEQADGYMVNQDEVQTEPEPLETVTDTDQPEGSNTEVNQGDSPSLTNVRPPNEQVETLETKSEPQDKENKIVPQVSQSEAAQKAFDSEEVSSHTSNKKADKRRLCGSECITKDQILKLSETLSRDDQQKIFILYNLRVKGGGVFSRGDFDRFAAAGGDARANKSRIGFRVRPALSPDHLTQGRKHALNQ